jgi:hypothetical protein
MKKVMRSVKSKVLKPKKTVKKASNGALMSNTPPKNTDGVITKNRIKTARNIRNTSRQNQDGSKSTHIMEWGEGTGSGKRKYTVNPTIFPNKDGSWTDLGGSEDRMAAYKEAKKRGEVFGFGSAKRAEKFAAGSWKKGEDRKESMKEYRTAKKKKELYTQSKEFKLSRKKSKIK